MVWKHNDNLISKLNLDCHIFVENVVVCDWKIGLHYKAILAQVLNLHNYGEMEEVVNLIFQCKNLQDTSTT